jgi:hypothetical protein
MTLKRVLLLLVCLLSAESASPLSLEEARRELEGMLDVNLAISDEIENALKLFGEESGEPEELRRRKRAINRECFVRIEEIVRVHGWPKEAEVGAAAAKGAILVVLSADASEQQRILPVLIEQAELFELRRASIAEIEDRVLVYEGQPQKYGSQFYADAESGVRRLYPIEDCENVEFLRTSVGLEPLSKFAGALGINYDPCANG